MKKVFIVVLNWNQAKLTRECIESLRGLRQGSYELRIVVVDNASTEKLSIRDTKIKVIKNRENLGFVGGNNVGIAYALGRGADYVMTLNNDTRVDPDLVKELLKAAGEEKGVGAISPKIYFARGFEFHKKRYQKRDLGRVIWYAGGKIDWENVYGTARGVDEVDQGQYDEEGETDFATGACMFLSRMALETVGLFDERYYMYYEDTELSQRIKRAGYKVMYNPRGVVWHKVAQSSGIGSDLNDYFTTRNRMLFGMRYAEMRTKFALMRESIKLLLKGRKWQRIGIRDFYLGKLGRGSWQ